MAVPIHSTKAHQRAGVLVVGVSARLRLDHLYLGFPDLVASQIATACRRAGRARPREDGILLQCRPGLPVLLLTGYADADIADALVNLLRKPVSDAALMECAAALLMAGGDSACPAAGESAAAAR